MSRWLAWKWLSKLVTQVLASLTGGLGVHVASQRASTRNGLRKMLAQAVVMTTEVAGQVGLGRFHKREKGVQRSPVSGYSHVGVWVGASRMRRFQSLTCPSRKTRSIPLRQTICAWARSSLVSSLCFTLPWCTALDAAT